MPDTMPLLREINIGSRTAANRIVINAMECCDADTAGNPTETTYRRYEKLFQGGAGVILVEALSVMDESRGRLHQLTALPQNQPALARFVRTVKQVNPRPIMLWQLTHSGELSHPEFSKRVCVKPLPGYEGELLTEEQVDDILDKFVLAARMAHDCGADGIDFKLCHGYFGCQLLRPTTIASGNTAAPGPTGRASSTRPTNGWTGRSMIRTSSSARSSPSGRVFRAAWAPLPQIRR